MRFCPISLTSGWRSSASSTGACPMPATVGGSSWTPVSWAPPGEDRGVAEDRFGRASFPAAIVLTHGHFDHVEAPEDLAERWDVPVYAHELEFPYLDGSATYPPPDPSVGGGMAAPALRLLSARSRERQPAAPALPSDRSIPHMPGWQWIRAGAHAGSKSHSGGRKTGR